MLCLDFKARGEVYSKTPLTIGDIIIQNPEYQILYLVIAIRQSASGVTNDWALITSEDACAQWNIYKHLNKPGDLRSSPISIKKYL